MARVTPTQPHTRASSYKFYADARGRTDPIFVRRTAINQPPPARTPTKMQYWQRDLFARANHVWASFDASQRAFYRRIAIEVTTSLGGGRVELKLLSGQELFIALMMEVRTEAHFISLIPVRWVPSTRDLCNNLFAETTITLYSKSLKRTLFHGSADELGYFQWISIAPFAAPFRLTIESLCLGTITNQYETIEELLTATQAALLHPIKVFNTATQQWTYPIDPVWVRKSCSPSPHSIYQFNTVDRVLPGTTSHWRKPMVDVIPAPECTFYLRAGSYWVPGVGKVYWHDNFILDAPEWSWVIYSKYYHIDGRTGEVIE